MYHTFIATGFHQYGGTEFTLCSTELANIVISIITIGFMEHGKVADGMRSEEITQHQFSLGLALRTAFLRHSDLHEAIKMTGYFNGITPADGTENLIHCEVKRADNQEYGNE